MSFIPRTACSGDFITALEDAFDGAFVVFCVGACDKILFSNNKFCMRHPIAPSTFGEFKRATGFYGSSKAHINQR
ncbi:MAG: hypothetical protein COB30_008470 [Ectothiorhodospiraceae bacterium]|nr:hypothetical protein [Ectothiorhodospiraceae bacterium]